MGDRQLLAERSDLDAWWQRFHSRAEDLQGLPADLQVMLRDELRALRSAAALSAEARDRIDLGYQFTYPEGAIAVAEDATLSALWNTVMALAQERGR